MKASEIKKLNVGDKIEVSALHFREGRKKAIRKIVDIDSLGVGVRLFGWDSFKLKNSEILTKVQ